MEEATVSLGKCKVIGCQETNIEGDPIVYQLRYVAIIEDVKKHTVDPCTNKWCDRKFIDVDEFENYVKWGEIGKELIKVSKESFKEF